MKSVFSSHVAEIGYDDDEETLVVEYQNGSKVAYQGVPASVADQVVNAPSIGSALHRLIKDRYEHDYLDKPVSFKGRK
jgi:hypothetical protein